MDNLMVNGRRIGLNKYNQPSALAFVRSLGYKGPTTFEAQDGVDNLEDFVQVASKLTGQSTKAIWKTIQFASPTVVVVKPKKRISVLEKQDVFPVRKRPSVIDSSLSSSSFSFEKEPSRPLATLPSSEEEDPAIALPRLSIETNALALSALAKAQLVFGSNDPILHSKIKKASLPYIDALIAQGRVTPELQGEVQFGVSERMKMRGYDVPHGSVATAIGKRALELYRERYPGHVPPQRIGRTADGSHEFLMNVYTNSTAPKTLDVAIEEHLL